MVRQQMSRYPVFTLVHYSWAFFLHISLLHSFHVAPFLVLLCVVLASCLTFFCNALISCWALSVLHFFILHSFQVALFLCHTMFMLHFFVCCTLLLLHLFSCCSMLHSHHVALFCVALISCCTFPCCTFSALHIFHVVLFSCGIFFRVVPFSYCTFLRVALLSCCTFYLIASCCTLFMLDFLGIQASKFIKKRLHHRCFPVKFVQFWSTPILNNVSERMPLNIFSETFSMSKSCNIVILQGMNGLSYSDLSGFSLFRIQIYL